MTTPIVEITPSNSVTYNVLIGDGDFGFEDGVAELDNSAFMAMCAENASPFVVAMEWPVGVNGIFHGEPTACMYKKVSATLYDVSGDDPVAIADISSQIIVSTDGRIVFKPNIVRVVNGFVTNGYVDSIADLDDKAIEITIEATPAYTNPSATTPVYAPSVLSIHLALSGDYLSHLSPSNPVDYTPYIVYSNGTFEQPAI